MPRTPGSLHVIEGSTAHEDDAGCSYDLEVPMSYRNDHDAALLRITALEGELAQLKKQPPALAKPPQRAWPAIAASLLGVGAVVAAFAAMRATHNTEVEAAPTLAAPLELRTCAAGIRRVSLDAGSTDPRGGAASVAPLAATGAACRPELARVAVDDPKLERWRVAEDRLANVISLITVYYGNDPYALDHYASAPQLWREYEHARAERDLVLGSLAL